MSLVKARVDDKERLPLGDICALLENHLFQIALDAGVYLDKLLGTYAAYVFAIYIYMVGGYSLGHDRGQLLDSRPWPEYVV